MSSPTLPLVSIILPCRNESGRIKECLDSILRQELTEADLEIIIADGVSTDGTREYLQQVAAQSSSVRVLNNPGRIVSTGLNAALREARGQVIIRMDAHTIYAPDYVKQCLQVLRETGADNVGGPMRTTAVSYKERAIRAVFHSPFAVGGARSHDPDYEGYVDTVIYGCWHKSLFDRVGDFDEDLVRNQDDEHNLRILRSGGKVYQSPRIRSWYHVRDSFTALFRQYMQYGYWKVLVIRNHRLPASIRHLVPAAFVGSLALLLMLGWFWQPALWSALILTGVYLATVLAASVITASRNEWELLPVLPVAFCCFHLGYGYGFLRGILDFLVLHKAPAAKFVQLTRKRQPVSSEAP
ncbi:MAG: glycosyltransferase family 2 protein [Verrucomicrobia bacterium]|nr:MAG: glycosyltransferase family 2 protein [Verrucomicrobiota bacterium]